MSQHARLGPSDHTWPHCPGAPRENAQYEDVPGEAAIDGTGSHLLLEMCMNNNVRAESYDMQIIGVNHEDQPNGWLVDLDRIGRVNICLDYIVRRKKELTEQFPDHTIGVSSESRSNPGEFYHRDDWWGTVDICIVVKEKKHMQCVFLEVCDYKDGRMWVSEKDNTQLIAYLGGKILGHMLIDGGPCRMSIVQPKTSTPIRYIDQTKVQVISRLDELAEAAKKTDDPNALLIADGKGGKGYCRWCSHGRNGNCNAEANRSLSMVGNMSNMITTDGQNLFEVIGEMVADVTILSADELADLADAQPGIMAVFDKVNTEIKRRIELGESVPGYAMQPGNNSNKYSVSDDEIVKLLRARGMKKDEIFPAKLITPAALMKSDKLNEAQKTRFAKEHIKVVASTKLSLKQVARSEKLSVDMMFGDVPTFF